MHKMEVFMVIKSQKLTILLLFLGCSLPLLGNDLLNSNNNKPKSNYNPLSLEYLSQYKEYFKMIGIGMATHMTICLGHELGHASFFWCQKKPCRFGFTPLGAYIWTPINVFNSLKYKPAALAAGPIAGTMTCLAILKISNVYQEYLKNKDIKEAFKNGKNKQLSNPEHNLALHALCLAHLINNPRNFLRLGVNGTDGQLICEELKLIGLKGALARGLMASSLLGATFAYLKWDQAKKNKYL